MGAVRNFTKSLWEFPATGCRGQVQKGEPARELFIWSERLPVACRKATTAENGQPRYSSSEAVRE